MTFRPAPPRVLPLGFERLVGEVVRDVLLRGGGALRVRLDRDLARLALRRGSFAFVCGLVRGAAAAARRTRLGLAFPSRTPFRPPRTSCPSASATRSRGLA
jgi:hypothetical protein